MRSLFTFFAAALCVSAAVAQSPASAAWPPGPDHTTLQLWPSGAPGVKTATGPEHDTTTEQDQRIAGRPLMRLGDVSDPTITYYPAPAVTNSHAAVVVFPGGAYRILAIDLEGTEVCAWLNSINVNCVLLKYRVPDTGPYPKSPEALQDAQRAVGMVREHAADWKIDADKVGVLGFSAGGHLAAALSTHFDQRLYPPVDTADKLSCRPDFAIVIYPGYLSIAERDFEFNPDIPVASSTPPTFLVQAEDDPVHVENAVQYFMALKHAGVPAELHVFAKGGHGYGLRPTDLPVTHWPNAATVWLHTIGILPGPGE
jgi:acetyl esterase/lipase